MKKLFLIIALTIFFPTLLAAQTTVFNFQGRLNDGAAAANGNFEMQFKLFNALTAGTQIGATLSRPGVVVINGIFTTQLDFGATVFDGSGRFIEIGVRPAGSTTAFSILSPRQPILSTPYAIQAKNASQLGGIDASQYVTTTTVGSSFIKNATVQQTGNFNISGTGIVGDSFGIGTTPNSGYKFDMSGNARLTTANGAEITFAAPNAESGMSTIFNGGRSDIRFDGSTLKLVVALPGGPPSSTNGIAITTTGKVGIGTTTPSSRLEIMDSNPSLGLYDSGTSFLTSLQNQEGDLNLRTAGATLKLLRNGNITVGGTLFGGSGNGINIGNNLTVTGRTQLAGDAQINGSFFLVNLPGGGNTALCRSANTLIAACSSSLRYKTNIAPFGFGLTIVKSLRPISFDWKEGGMKDVGFGAEDVAAINPLFVTFNAKGEVEGVKYDRLSVIFVNAFKEQQAQIETQQKQLDILRLQIESLKILICSERSKVAVCNQ